MKKLIKDSLDRIRLPRVGWRQFACLVLVTGVLLSALSVLAPARQAAAATVPVTTFAAPGDSEENKSELSCGEGMDLSWIICPVVEGLILAINAIDNMIINQLSVGTDGTSGEPNKLYCTSGDHKEACAAYYSAWATFRNIALGLLAIAGLIIVISHAVGVEILDAYTIRKALPRLLIAALGIALSWQLMFILITLSNDVGFGIRNLIYAPFEGLHEDLKLNFGGDVAITLLGGIGYLAVGAFGLMTLAGAALLAVLVAFVVLTLREIAVIMMLILAPIFIVMYILPNTQRWYKFGWEAFSRMLLMFPLIAGLIAVGRVFSVIAIGSEGSNVTGQLNKVIGFAAYFAPYFLIPMTFQFSGSVMRGLGGFVNDRARGGFQALGQKRKENTQKRIQAAQKGGIYRNDLLGFNYKLRPGGKARRGGLGRALNTAGNYSLDIGDSGRQLLGRKVGKGNKNYNPGRWFFGRTSDILAEKIYSQTSQHSRKAMQDLGLHYSTGRALGGQLHYFTAPGKGLSDDTVSQINDQFGVKDEKGNLKRDENGNVVYRSPDGKRDIEDLANYLSESTDHTDSSGALHAAQELRAKSGLIGDVKGAGKEETQRADIRSVGLLTAAAAGRLENHELAAEHARFKEDDLPNHASYALEATNLLQDAATPKRVSQARGHGLTFDSDGKAYDVYTHDPTSADAQKSLMRMNTQEVGGSKSEDLDMTKHAWIAGLSEKKLKWDKDHQQLVVDPSKTKTEQELKQAEQLRKRVQAMATYTYGDSDVGMKLKDIYIAADLNPNDLDYRASPTAHEIAAGATAPPPPNPEDQQPPPGGPAPGA